MRRFANSLLLTALLLSGFNIAADDVDISFTLGAVRKLE